MSVKLVILKSGEDVIADITEMVLKDDTKENKRVVGYFLTRPCGVTLNNRNLDTLDIDIENSIEMFEDIPSEFIKISESGISKVDSIIKLIKVGYDGFLIGENFMKTSKPGESAYDFIKKVENEI